MYVILIKIFFYSICERPVFIILNVTSYFIKTHFGIFLLQIVGKYFPQSVHQIEMIYATSKSKNLLKFVP